MHVNVYVRWFDANQRSSVIHNIVIIYIYIIFICYRATVILYCICSLADTVECYLNCYTELEFVAEWHITKRDQIISEHKENLIISQPCMQFRQAIVLTF